MKELKDLVAGDKVVAYDKYDNRRIRSKGCKATKYHQ